jgi:uncharacterized protein DUF5020
MKKIFFALTLSTVFTAETPAQTLQLHYDLRHTISPAVYPANFPTLYFEYWKARDSGKAQSRRRRLQTSALCPDSLISSQRIRGTFIKPGNFLLKTETDLQGAGNNVGKFFIQVSQSFRAWKPKIFLQLQYSGGAGITEPKQYSYYINNTFAAGAEIPFHWKGAWFSSILDYKYVAYSRPSQDPIFTFYWWKGLFNYKMELAGDFSCWTENKDHGDPATAGQPGKRFFFFAEPQFWFNITHTLALGSKINTYYNVNTPNSVWQVYPTVALRAKL